MGSKLDRYPYLLLRTTQGNRYLSLAGKNCWTIGRSNDNDFVLSDHWVSRNHAMLQQTDTGDYYLIDLGSRNGTFVNGRRVTFPMHLRHLDQISFGLTRIELHSVVDTSVDEETNSATQATLDSESYQRCLVSVLIANIHDFASLSQTREESTIPRLMGDWLRQSNLILRRSNCSVTQYLSEMVVGIWFHQDSFTCKQVVQVLQATHAFTQVTTQLAHKYDLLNPVQVGVGISGGYATISKVGGDNQLEYNVLGRPINTAMHFQRATRKLNADVVLGEETYQTLTQTEATMLAFQKHRLTLKSDTRLRTAYSTNFDQLKDFLGNLNL